jgi:adenine/guanine phosphoribosyltransferase-like PRPP-binding protein
MNDATAFILTGVICATTGGLVVGGLTSVDFGVKLVEAKSHYQQQVKDLETEYAARYKTDLELIDECVADGLKRYRCVMELKR